MKDFNDIHGVLEDYYSPPQRRGPWSREKEEEEKERNRGGGGEANNLCKVYETWVH